MDAAMAEKQRQRAKQEGWNYTQCWRKAEIERNSDKIGKWICIPRLSIKNIRLVWPIFTQILLFHKWLDVLCTINEYPWKNPIQTESTMIQNETSGKTQTFSRVHTTENHKHKVFNVFPSERFWFNAAFFHELLVNVNNFMLCCTVQVNWFVINVNPNW